MLLLRLAVLFLALVSTAPAHAATFGALTGTLAIRAGDDPQQMATAAVGSTGLSDTDQDLTTGGFHQASSSLTFSRLGGYKILFSSLASSVTTKNAPAAATHATATVEFSQSFTTTSQQWLEFTAKVTSPPSDPNIFALTTVTRVPQSTPLFSQADSGAATITQKGLFPAATYRLDGVITTSASVAGAHSGLIEGSVLIASLADFNGDHAVSGSDLALIRANYGSTTGLFANGDLDGNGRTDGDDILLGQRQLGTVAPVGSEASPVPEPASGLLFAGALLASAHYCRMCRSAARRASPSPAR